MNINFKGAYRVCVSNSNYDYSPEIDPVVPETMNLLAGKPSMVYDSKISAKIGDFLKSYIKDYSENTGIVYIKQKENSKLAKPGSRNAYATYVFTGEDAKKANAIKKQSQGELKEIEKKYLKGALDIPMFSKDRAELSNEKAHRNERNNVIVKKEEAITQMHGNSSLISIRNNSDGSLNSIEFYDPKQRTDAICVI